MTLPPRQQTSKDLQDAVTNFKAFLNRLSQEEKDSKDVKRALELIEDMERLNFTHSRELTAEWHAMHRLVTILERL